MNEELIAYLIQTDESDGSEEEELVWEGLEKPNEDELDALSPSELQQLLSQYQQSELVDDDELLAELLPEEEPDPNGDWF